MGLHDKVRESPGACLFLVSRARLRAEKRGRPLDEVLPEYLNDESKLRGALQASHGLSIRQVWAEIADEQYDFHRARLREVPEEAAQINAVRMLVNDVTGIAESIIPGIYFDAVAT